MRLPDLGSSIESNVSAAIEWKKNLSSPRELELINKRRAKNVSFPKVDILDNFKSKQEMHVHNLDILS